MTIAPRQTAMLAVVAVLALALALSLVAAPAAAQQATDNPYLEMMRAATATSASTSGPGGAQFAQIGECLGDETGDEIDFDEPDAEGSEPRADLVEHCVNYGPTLSLSATVAEPTDPTTDGGWQGATFVGWFIDIANDDTDFDGEADFFVRYHLDVSGTLVGAVVDVRGDQEAPACDATPTFTGIYGVSGIGRDCVDGATGVRVSVAVFYDRTPTEEGDVWYDQAPSDGTFTETVEAGPAARQTQRYSVPGGNRIDTAVAISRAQFPEGPVRLVYIARADEFPDALAGGVVTEGPILLVPSEGTLPGPVGSEIDRLEPDQVVALGGTAAVSEDMLAQAAQGRDAGRLSQPGTGRVETAVAISQHQFPAGAPELYLARADDFPDALAGGTLTDGPILLVPREGAVPPVVQQEIDRVGPARVVALGGTAAIADEVLSAAGGGRETLRLSIPGGGRVQTALAIARYQFPDGANDVYLARADDFPDALAGGVLTGGPILLVPRTLGDPPSAENFPPNVAAEISRLAAESMTALGGTAAVSDEVLQQAASN
ncbi:MAG: cell wall-binding repeat-containing protein [Egibacteraceae bacterium]